MAFPHRELLNESAVDPVIANFCEPYCNGTRTPDGICPLTCVNFCPFDCKPHPLLIQPPAPPPPPPISGFDSPPDKSNRLSLILTISLAILAMTFFFFTCYTIYKFYTNWHNSRRRRSQGRQMVEESGPDDFLDEDHGPVVDHPIWYIRTVGLQPSVISAITIFKYKKGDRLIEGTDCSVCLNEFQEDENLRLLPKCNHAFHISCIDTWLRSHTNCPLCRAVIVNTAAALPSQERNDRNSGLVEEARVEVSRSNREVRREPENEAPELRIGIEDHVESRADQIGLKIDESLEETGLDGVQPLRRSVSLDSLSASMISAAISNGFSGQSDRNSDNQTIEVKESIAKRVGLNQSLSRFVASPSVGRPMQMGSSSSMKRSLSCSAKELLSRHSSRSRNSVIPQ